MPTTLEATQGQILSQYPTDATRFCMGVDLRNHLWALGLPSTRIKFSPDPGSNTWEGEFGCRWAGRKAGGFVGRLVGRYVGGQAGGRQVASRCKWTCWVPPNHPGGNPGANLKSISHSCHPLLVVFVWELTKETNYLPLGYLQGGPQFRGVFLSGHAGCAVQIRRLWSEIGPGFAELVGPNRQR